MGKMRSKPFEKYGDSINDEDIIKKVDKNRQVFNRTKIHIIVWMMILGTVVDQTFKLFFPKKDDNEGTLIINNENKLIDFKVMEVKEMEITLISYSEKKNSTYINGKK